MSTKTILILAALITVVMVIPPVLLGWLFPSVTVMTLRGMEIATAASYSFVGACMAFIVAGALR